MGLRDLLWTIKSQWEPPYKTLQDYKEGTWAYLTDSTCALTHSHAHVNTLITLLRQKSEDSVQTDVVCEALTHSDWFRLIPLVTVRLSATLLSLVKPFTALTRAHNDTRKSAGAVLVYDHVLPVNRHAWSLIYSLQHPCSAASGFMSLSLDSSCWWCRDEGIQEKRLFTLWSHRGLQSLYIPSVFTQPLHSGLFASMATWCCDGDRSVFFFFFRYWWFFFVTDNR